MKKTKKVDEKRLAAYTAAAYTAAAGAVLLAAAPASAEIHYTAADLTFSDSSAFINIDGSGDPELEMRHFYSTSSYIWGDFQMQNGASFVRDVSSSFYYYPLAWNFTAGQNIGPGSDGNKYWTQGDSGWGSLYDYYYQYGNFGPGSTGYLGIRFDVPDDGTKYGWIHVSEVAKDYTSFKVDGWAYDDSGAPIGAGVVPEPSSMVLFAVGAAGMAVLRKRKKK